MAPGLLALGAPARLVTPADGLAGNQLELLALLAALSLVPFAIVMLTSFSKMAVVLSIVRSALGTQQAPPTLVLTGLAAVLTAAVMSPTCEQMWAAGRGAWEGTPSAAGLVEQAPAVAAPLRAFLLKHGSAEERARFADLARELRGPEEAAKVSEGDAAVVVPAFVLTELKEAFIIGFLVFLPFLILDMLIANILVALGMQTLSPTQVSLPFKLLLFVSVDGWALLSRGLILGYR
jgi:type III secretion protein R